LRVASPWRCRNGRVMGRRGRISVFNAGSGIVSGGVQQAIDPRLANDLGARSSEACSPCNVLAAYYRAALVCIVSAGRAVTNIGDRKKTHASPRRKASWYRISVRHALLKREYCETPLCAGAAGPGRQIEFFFLQVGAFVLL